MYETFSQKASEAVSTAFPQVSINNVYEVHKSTSDVIDSPEEIIFVIRNANWQMISDIFIIIRDIVPARIAFQVWHDANYKSD